MYQYYGFNCLIQIMFPIKLIGQLLSVERVLQLKLGEKYIRMLRIFV